MDKFDVILILLIISALIAGWKQGVIKEFNWLVGLIIGLMAVPLFIQPITKFLVSTSLYNTLINNTLNKYPLTIELNWKLCYWITSLLSFFIIMFASRFAMDILFNVENFLHDSIVISLADKISGAIWNLTKVLVVVWILLYLTEESNLEPLIRLKHDLVNNSLLLHYLNQNNILATIF